MMLYLNHHEPMSISTPPTASASVAHQSAPKRLIASYSQHAPGPTTIVLTAIHGNEPRTVEAAERVCAELEQLDAPFSGRICVLMGNRRAFDEGVRFVDVDLNRTFTYDFNGTLRLHQIEQDIAEAHEQRELIASLKSILQQRDTNYPVYAIDLHTFSGQGAPFSVFSDTLRNRAFAECWPVPFILGLAEQLPGTVIDYLSAAGCIAATIETGQHEDPVSADLHTAALRLALVRAGHVQPEALASLGDDFQMLAEAARGIPRVLDVQMRHAITPADHFRMKPGFANFDPVTASQHLGEDISGPVRAERSGRLLLPLYQSQGSDGYFIARPIGCFWLELSAWLRRIHLDNFLDVLPGVRRHHIKSGTLIVNRRLARWLVNDVFHLFGYRLWREDGEELIIVRRPHDRRGPDRIDLGI